MSAETQLTPMMQQYRRIKGELPKDAILLFRLGDFYEMFFDDAKDGAQLLNLSLTARNGTPMCGLPFHAANNYIARILRAGRKVAICEQTEEARPGKLVNREVTQILSPGTHFDERMLVAERNNFLASVYPSGKIFGLALVDLTTGDFLTTELENDIALLAELERLRPAEIIFPTEAVSLRDLLRGTFQILSGYDDWTFAPETAFFTVKEQFKVASLDGFGLKDRNAAIGAAGGALHYLTQSLRRDVKHLTRISFYQRSDFLMLDHTTLRHLEILEPQHHEAPRHASLYGALNKTATPMGARLLRQWLSQPLATVEPIRQRQEAVATFINNTFGLDSFRQQLANVRDLERTIGRLSSGSGNARDLVALRLALEQIPVLKQILQNVKQKFSGQNDSLKEESLFDATWEFQPQGIGFFGPIFVQFQNRPSEAIAWLQKIQCGEALAALTHPEVGAIDFIWGKTDQNGSGFGLAKIFRRHPEMIQHFPEKILAMRKLLANENTILLGDLKGEAVIRLNALGVSKRWLLTAYEKIEPAWAGRTIDILSEKAVPPSELDEKLNQLLNVASPLSEFENGNENLISKLAGQVSESPELVDLIARAIVDEPPLPIKEGGMIRDHFDEALDELRHAQRGGKDWIAKLQADEIERTGISSLKVRFNSVFGYYIEITKSNLDKVPAHYHRKQTVANGERFITPELKEMEGKILGAEERSVKLEYEIFQRVRETVLGKLKEIQQTASALAQLDVLGSFAETARLHNYCRPQISEEGVLQIRDGRHPVLEQQFLEERFVPNDTNFSHELQIALITGPNMAGKSTYIRQVALLTLLAHTGSFVPAAEARIDLVDRIFTRIGASDDLSRGQSTFMVEMTETANILNNATARSLIVLDEIGRGTSTFDGLSLAWSIVEFLHNQVGAKTLFATHYHELTELAARLPRIKNFNVAVREWHDQIVFLRKIVEGGTDKSYGIQVARLAGVPKEVLERAKQILSNLEESELTPEGNVRQPRRAQDREKLKNLAPAPQMDLFG